MRTESDDVEYSIDAEDLSVSMLLLAGPDLPEVKLERKDSEKVFVKEIDNLYLELFSF